ncbi:histidine phosphatase family protein [Streptomyces sp. NPDC050529]|uniref:histidine phosphatase family protein n=1 Tax=unclassified Streptomyces TaxID=2593676 RepID=UPI002DD9D564|nr:histidine phosphatase family protein [Streptomyces sp. NBC_01022]WRZ79286.1 histidine phosphatase family protein [Streptomyces sp. NBC_01022]WRZ86390.1 histidine phosphatase family protein [Streptomyces sp. NBC_01022]
MTIRVMLISPAMNAALREARFAGDAPLDDAGLRQARAAAQGVPAADLTLHGPSGRCALTAGALGLRSAADHALGDWELGRWTGARLDEVSASEPEEVAAWLADPSAAPHGGESLLDLCARAGAWLDSLQGSGDGRVLAVVEPAVVRAALVHALALPPQAFWRFDVAPLTLTELSGRSGRWNLRCGRPLTAEPVD